MTAKIRRRTVYALTIDADVDDEDDRELELTHKPDEYGDEPQIFRLPDGRVIVGYLSHDDDCCSPLEDCDGMGEILDARRNYGGSQAASRIRSLLGIDEYGDPLEDETPDPLVVFLDVYSHGGDAWRVSGSGRSFPDEQWDVSNHAGLWVPDDCCRENIVYTAVKSFLPPSLSVGYSSKAPYGKNGKGYLNRITARVQVDKRVQTMLRNRGRKVPTCDSINLRPAGYASFEAAVKAACQFYGISYSPEQLAERQRVAAVEMAQGVIEEYNKWLSGDCYGVVVEVFDTDGDPIGAEEEACWGFIGREYAEQELRSTFESVKKSLLNPT